MADPEDASNEVNDELDNEGNDYDEAAPTSSPVLPESSSSTTTTIDSLVIESSTPSVGPAAEYDDDEPLEDYVVKLVVNGEPESSTFVKDLVDAGLAENAGDPSSKTSAVIDAINGYTSTVLGELADNATAITGEGKRWWGWSTRTWIIFGLIALAVLGLLIALILCLVSKRGGKNKRTQTTGATTTTKAVVTKGISPNERYQQVPNV